MAVDTKIKIFGWIIKPNERKMKSNIIDYRINVLALNYELFFFHFVRATRYNLCDDVQSNRKVFFYLFALTNKYV